MAGHEIDLILAALGIAGGTESLRSAESTRRAARLALGRHGELLTGFARAGLLSEVEVSLTVLDADAPKSELSRAGPSLAEIEAAVHTLAPWKKGPFLLSRAGEGNLAIDAEWRSDLKWQRVLALGATFSGKRVIDVGTGNGYFLLRLLGAGAAVADGVEPSVRSILQFLAVRALFGAPHCSLWPLRLEDLPPEGLEYDIVMSMGVLYHQRDPVQHLRDLGRLIAPEGELILETIALDTPEPLYIQKGQRYAGMRNVYVIPNEASVRSWLDQAGFEVLCLGAAVPTTSEEQRATDFARGPSLSNVLAPDPRAAGDAGRQTCEGHPRPVRQALRAIRKRGNP